MLVAFATFSLAATLVLLLPGPDTLVVLRSFVRGGRIVALRTVGGVLTGLSIWVVTAALGLSEVLRASHDAYLGLRFAGGLYLIVLGVRSLQARALPVVDEGEGPRGLARSGYGAGLLTDLLNPKVGVFFVTFLPGFVPAHEPVGSTSLAFGAILITLTALYFSIMMFASGPVTRWLSSVRARRRIERCTGLVLIGFGLRLALDP